MNCLSSYSTFYVFIFFFITFFQSYREKGRLEGGKALRTVNLLPTRDELDVKCHQWPGTMCTLRPVRHIVGCNFN